MATKKHAPAGAQAWRNHEALTFNGSMDSHKNQPGRDYRAITLGELFDGLATPAHKPKDKAPAFIPSAYRKHDGRGFDVQRQHGRYVALTGDIDKGDHTLEEVAQLAQDFAGEGAAVAVYSSASKRPGAAKWRLVIPLAEPVIFEDWHAAQWGLVKWCEVNGVELDTALTRAAQTVYLPNVPSEHVSSEGVVTRLRGDDGAPLFYEWWAADGGGLSLSAAEGMAGDFITAARDEIEQQRQQDAERARAAKEKAAQRAATGAGSVVDQFNDSHDLEELLSRYGYTPGPGASWRSPYQTSKTFGTSVVRAADGRPRWISVSGSDADAGLGLAGRNGARFGDAFDLFAHFEHGGDQRKARKAITPKPEPKKARAPAPAAPDKGKDEASASDKGQPVADGGGTPGEQQEADEAPAFSEISLAEQFAAQAVDRFRWSPGMEWMSNHGAHWERDGKLGRYSLAKEVCKGAAQAVEKAHHANKLTSASTVNAVLGLARSEAGIVTPVDAWDAHPMLLNTPAGVFDLETGRTVSRNGLLFTQITRAAPAAMKTPVWDRFVSEVFGGDLEMVEFIQRMGGYSLTGSTDEQKLFYLHGSGANGKSVFLEVLRSIAGAYAHDLPAEVLMTSKHERHPTSLAALQGKRVAVSSEIEDGAHWAEARIKSLTGDSSLTARFMRGDEFTFNITHKHILAGNFKPRLKGDDFAMVRRMVLVPFEQRFEGTRRDERLPQKLRAEYPGILQWFIEGARKWVADGLRIPSAVAEASSEYMNDQNDLLQWINERCHLGGPAADERSSALYADFKEWKEARGERPQAQGTFSERLEKMGKDGMGIRKLKTKRANVFIGICLKPAGTKPEDWTSAD